MRIGEESDNINRGASVEGREYDFGGEQENITRVKEVTHGSGRLW